MAFISGATDFSGSTSSLIISGATFGGGVTNAGTIGTGGLVLESAAFLSGGEIIDTGIISGGISIQAGSEIVAAANKGAIVISNTADFSGGVHNAGVISAAKTGLFIYNVGTVTAGITNTGHLGRRHRH